MQAAGARAAAAAGGVIAASADTVRLGLRENLAQFSLLVLVNGFVLDKCSLSTVAP